MIQTGRTPFSRRTTIAKGNSDGPRSASGAALPAIALVVLTSVCTVSCNLLTNGIFPSDFGETVSAPTMTPAAGTFSSSQTVALATDTQKATIYYTIDGSTPTTSSPVYVSPIVITANTTVVRAIGARMGLVKSPVVSGTYVISSVVATPQFIPAPGTYPTNQAVAITCGTAGATIYYTTDGTTPTTASSVYGSSIAVSGDGTSMLVRALAVKAGMTDSAIAPATYTINAPVADPVFGPTNGGRIGHLSPPWLTCSTTGATIVYTTDGSVPTESGGVITNGIQYNISVGVLPYGSTTVKAMAFKIGKADSAVVSATFTEPEFAYTVDQGASMLYAHQIDVATGSLSAVNTYPVASTANSVAVDVTGKFVYVANMVSKTISAFRIDPDTGALSAVSGQPFSTGSDQPYFLACDKTGQYLYATVNAASKILGFSINTTTGALTSLSPGTFVTSGAPGGLAMAQGSGYYLYVAIPGSPGSVDSFKINADGSLSSIGNVTTAPQTGTFAVTADPANRFLFAVNQGSATVSTFSINPATGALTAGPTTGVGTTPIAAAADPISGSFLYVADHAGSVYAFTVQPVTGALNPVGSWPVPSPISLSVDPSGNWLYVATHIAGKLNSFHINRSNAALGPVASTGTGTNAISVTTAGPW